MTTAPTTAGPNPISAARGGAPSPSPATPVASIDPIKLLTKYRWVLVAAVIGGVLFGLAMHYLLLVVYPVWRAQAIFEVLTVQADPTKPVGSQQVDDVTFERYMQSQTKMMTSNVVLQLVAEDTQLPTEAPTWCKRFMKSGTLNTAEAFLELQDKVSSRVIPQTAYIELAMSYQDKKDVTAIVRLTKEKYLATIKAQVDRVNQDQLSQLRKAIDQMDVQQKGLQGARDRLMTDNRVDTVSRQVPQATEQLRLVDQELTKLNLDRKAFDTRRKGMEDDLKSVGGVQFSAQLRDEVETEPLLQQVKQTISGLESEKRSLLQRFTPEHRQVRELETALKGYEQNLVAQREKLLQQKFDAQLDGLRKALLQLDAQITDLSEKKATLSTRLTELTRIQSQIEDLDSQIRQGIESRNRAEQDLRALISLTGLSTNQRVMVAVGERQPDEISFPKLQIMLPAGLLVMVAGVMGVLVLREIVDQRIKSPADVALIPRARMLGFVPDAAEDPAGVDNVAMAFRDKDRGVMAECYRQIRASVLKRTQQTGHKTILIVGGMPGSGATSVASNLAFALAAADRRILIVDANMRRPMQHKVFGLGEAPGLADVLAGSSGLDTVIQHTTDKRVDVLTAGSKDKRDFERLSADLMGELLKEAKGKYDYVLVDAAPLVVSGDGMGLAGRCDASILVVRAMQEKRGMVSRLRNDLADSKAELLGILLNGVESAAGGYMKGNLKATHEYQTQAS